MRSFASTRCPKAIPSPKELLVRARGLALLSCIFEGTDGKPQFDLQPEWGPGEPMAEHDDGSGNRLIIWFGKAGTVILGFDHESVMSPFRSKPPKLWPGLFEGFPPELAYARSEPAFEANEAVTFALWRLASARTWSLGPVEFPDKAGKVSAWWRGEEAPLVVDPDGSEALLAAFTCTPEVYAARLSEDWECDVPAKAVGRVFSGKSVDAALVEAINPDADVEEVLEVATTLGFSTGE